MKPVTRYTRSGGASIAYQIAGEGRLDLLFMTGWISQVEQLWESAGLRRMLERLTDSCRLILFDRRGTGLSDGAGQTYTLEQEAEDALAVLDAAGSERAALFTYGLGGPVAALLAAERPDRVGALIMYASIARTLWAPDYDWAMTREERTEWIERTVESWGATDHPGIPVMAPSMADDATLVSWFARLQRLAAGPGGARELLQASAELDVREQLPRIRVPTLVMHRAGDTAWDPRHSRYIAEHVPGARYVELDGTDSLPFLGDSDAIVEEIEEFLTGGRAGGERSRALLTVMFTDIVDATARAAELGDGRWRDLLARHDEELRKELHRFDGHAVKSVGDGFLATFSGPPSRALRGALAITESARELGIEVRVGLHTGECELIGDDVGGMAVHIASRVGALAGAGEVLVSGTVFGTVVGGPFTFSDRGFHELKGVPGRWPLFALGDRPPAARREFG
ncbi:MAG TPA: alpha/beta fold hydrolase [Solirubrobacteraceae bacterium]|jgi:pimeloyl-ACP methyl ester carboxylesterase/class 3 adenylate cyclase|nr:alpha/beta fold hydrolase [Solirubrobacteraceae bacterium]